MNELVRVIVRETGLRASAAWARVFKMAKKARKPGLCELAA